MNLIRLKWTRIIYPYVYKIGSKKTEYIYFFLTDKTIRDLENGLHPQRIAKKIIKKIGSFDDIARVKI